MSRLSPSLPPVAAVSVLVALTAAAVPSAASADYASANTWAGGSVSAQRADIGTIVSMVTSPTRARMRVRVLTGQCAVLVTIPRAAVTVQPGGVADLQQLAVTATASRSDLGTPIRFAVTMTPAGPGVLAGHVSLLGHTRSGGKRVVCRAEQDFRVRSRATFEVPMWFASDPALPRSGFLWSPVGVRMPGAIAVAREPDGHVHAIFDLVYTRGGVRRAVPEYVLARWKPRADGSFAATLRSRSDGGSGTRRYRVTQSGRLEGQLPAGGILAGTFINRVRFKGIAGNTARYRSRSTGVVRFQAAP